MGIRSDLSKELKALLGSEVIRGKVTVQRAYADWRRYPQYIVPLSEASIDLIFAPAYGSNKKNATDIRMAIDGMELVFTRPEIGTFILLTGDSDFSSLVLKLKEYGKYVIGVGIQESSSDILVQNCDEYYSYTALSGLRRTDEGGRESTTDPWTLVERAVEQMGRRGDVMRSDRLKQVLLELDPGFDQKAVGFSKFSKFVSEASRRGLLQTRRMENGQYEIVAGKGGGAREEAEHSAPRQERGRRRRESDRGGRSESRDVARPSSDANTASDAASPDSRAPEASTAADQGVSRDGEGRVASPSALEGATGDVEAAFTLLRRAISDLLDDQESESVRDSDVKRRMLALDGDFDEGKLSFPKFSRFLRHAQERGVIALKQTEEGQFHVSLGDRSTAAVVAASPAAESVVAPDAPADRSASSPERSVTAPERSATVPDRSATPSDGSATPAVRPSGSESGRLRPRDGSVRTGKGRGEAPPMYQGQAVPRVGSSSLSGSSSPSRAEPAPSRGSSAGEGGLSTGGVAAGASSPVEVERLHLPKDPENVIRYLTNSYGGVGRKTAETLVETLGTSLFEVLASNPERVRQILPSSRADLVLEGWQADLARRRERYLLTGSDAGVQAEESPLAGGGRDTSVVLAQPALAAAQAAFAAAQAVAVAPVEVAARAEGTVMPADDVAPAEAESRRRGRRTRDSTPLD
jgi:uncharacterized protein (TIGR00288 family)